MHRYIHTYTLYTYMYIHCICTYVRTYIHTYVNKKLTFHFVLCTFYTSVLL